MKTQGIKIEEGREGTRAVRVVDSFGIPNTGCFGARVRICLILRELTFLATTKSPEECVGKGVSSVRSILGEVVRSANITNSIR